MEISLFNPLFWIFIYFALRGVRAIVKYQTQQKEHKKLIEKAQRYKDHRDATFEEFVTDNQNLIPNQEIQKKILECKSLRQLQDGLEGGVFTSVQLLMHYIKRCQTYGLKLNLISHLNFENALVMAKQCDQDRRDKDKMKLIKETTEDNGLLFGIPVSVKEHLFLKGTSCTLGWANLLDYVCEDTGIVEDLIVSNGGIPFVKTNIPQLLLSMESNNKLFGQAKNPIDHNKVPGGSSGGWAGLVATQSSPLSFGTDIGGSIRGPASFWGIYGFKPTAKRTTQKVSSTYREQYLKSQEQICSSIGPLAYCMDDVIFTIKLLFNYKGKNIDPYVASLGFNEDELNTFKSKKKLRLGYFIDNGLAECTKSVKKGMKNVIEGLTKEGHELISIDVSSILQNVPSIYVKLLLSNDMNMRAIGHENFMPDYQNIRLAFNTPSFLKPLVARVLGFQGQNRIKAYAENIGVKNTTNFYKAAFEKIKLAEEFEAIFRDNQLDGILSPTFALPAFKHGQFKNIGFWVFYCALWNLLDFPSCVIPRVHIVEKDETDPNDYSDSIYGEDNITRAIKDWIKGTEGLPISIQISTLPFQDEKCLGLAKNIDEGLKNQNVIQELHLQDIN